MLKRIEFEILDIRSTGELGVSYLIKALFPSPLGFIGKCLSFYGDVLFALRRVTFPLIVSFLYANNETQKRKKLDFLKKDALRFAAFILFLARKPTLQSTTKKSLDVENPKNR